MRVGRTTADARRWEAALAAQGVLVRSCQDGWLRLVTHRHVDDMAVAATLGAFATVLGASNASRAVPTV